MLLGTATAGAAQTVITLNFLPEYLLFNATTANAPSLLRIDIEGDGNLVNLDAAGLNALCAINMPGRVPFNYMLQLADGLVANKVVTITITNVVGNPAIPLWGRSKHKSGTTYLQMMQFACVANTGREFTKFSYLALPAAVTVNDLILVDYRDGLTQRIDAVEMQADNMLYQNTVVATVQGINNTESRIAKVTFQPVLAQNAYVMRMQPVGAISGVA